MFRQRLRARDFGFSRFVSRALVVAFALLLAFYGAMIVLLALKVSPATVNALSGYRDAYDFLAGLDAEDVTSRTRLIVGLAGLAAFLVFGYLAWREVPRPYLARGDLQLSSDERGDVEVSARAIERAAEAAALEHPSVVDARALYATDALTLEIGARRARDVDATLTDVHERAAASLRRHQLPALPVNVTLTHLERQTRRELA